MALQNLSTNFKHGNYEASRNFDIKNSENPNLATGRASGPSQDYDQVHIVDGNPTIGYGWDLAVNGEAATRNLLSQSSIMLTSS